MCDWVDLNSQSFYAIGDKLINPIVGEFIYSYKTRLTEVGNSQLERIEIADGS